MKKLLVISGPTGTGKTALALIIADKFNGEIVSADSRQIYKGMDIGTGKTPSSAQVKKYDKYCLVDNIQVYLYDLIDPDKSFSVAEYQQLAYEAIRKIQEKNKLPILVGGTGLYLQSVTEGLKIPKVKPNKKLREKLEAKPLQTLVSELNKVDPQTAQSIDKKNPRRLVRALEVFYETGNGLSELKRKFKVEFDILSIGLTGDRIRLYKLGDLRIDKWFEEGLVEEVRELIKKGYKNSFGLSALGYRQASMYIEGKISLDEAKKRIKFEHHRYVRRQLTWFRKSKIDRWFDIEEKDLNKKIVGLIQGWLDKNK